MEYAFRNTFTRFLLVLGVLALLTSLVWAQGGTGELQGLVTDPSGAVVANVSVTLTNTATAEKRTTVTTPAGLYRFVALPVVGTYTLEMSPKGFKSAKVSGILITVGATINEDVHLELGAASEQVTVEAGAQLVQTTESSLSGLVDSRVWRNMPLETRSQNEFIGLLAGAVPGGTAQVLDRGAAVNGARSGSGNFLVEGFDNNDQGLGGGGSLVGPGGANTTISPDAIQEYRVIEHNFPAEFGRSGGFVTDTVLKGGTNQWHGSLFEYNRIQALAANSFFSNRNGAKDALVRNQFGGSIGGPVVKDKTFFYFTTEIHRLRQGTPNTVTGTTPDFLNFVNTGGLEAFNETDPNGFCVLNASVFGAPFTGPCPGAFANSATLGPKFASLLATQPFPLCVPGAANCKSLSNAARGVYTGDGFGFGFAPIVYPVPVYGLLTVIDPGSTNQTRYTAKIDHKMGGKDQLNGAFLYDNADAVDGTQGCGSDFTLSTGCIGPTQPTHGRAMNAGITWTHILSPTVLNQFRISYTRHTSNFPGDPKANAAGVPQIEAAAFDQLGTTLGNASNLPQFFTENDFTYKDDLSVTKGKHSLKGGGSFTRTRNGSSFQASTNGEFSFNSIESLVTDGFFDEEADQLYAGYPGYFGAFAFAQASVDPTTNQKPDYYRGYRANEAAAYIQDDWRIHPRLTLNLGLRWEYFGPPHNFRNGVDSNFYFGSPVTPIVTTSTNPFFPKNNPYYAKVATGAFRQVDHSIWNKDLNNWGPRFGFAWDTFGTQKLVVRGAYGISYDRMYNNIFENIRFNLPFFCFCNVGIFGSGGTAGPLSVPGLYTVPFSSTSAFLAAGSKSSPRHINQDLVAAYYHQMNFGFQYEISKDFVLETNVVGTLGRKLLGILNNNTFDGRLSGAGSTTRPNTTINSDNFRTNAFTSNYYAWQTSLRKNFSHGLQFNANYTYSKALDQLSDVFSGRQADFRPTDSSNVHLDYGPADFDVKHRFVASATYDLPFLKANRWLGGWALSSIVVIQSGVPFSVYDSNVDTNADGVFNDRVSFNSGFNPGNVINGSSHPADGYFNTAAFSDTNCGTQNGGFWCQGGTGRNILRAPGYKNVDFGISKGFKITESAKLTLQGNFFNLFNHTNFLTPTSDLADPTNYGKSTATFNPGQGGARVTQLSLRFDF
jgi:hypothetical protein